MLFQPLLCLIALLWAGTARAPVELRIYFAAQLANILIASFSYERVRPEMYLALYIVGESLILSSMGYMLWTSVRSIKMLALSAVIAGVVVFLAARDVKVWDVFSWTVVTEGGLLSFAATAMAFRTPFLARKKVYIALVTLWASLAIFDFAYAVGYSARNPSIEVLNRFLPTLLFVGVFLYIGWKLRYVEAQ